MYKENDRQDSGSYQSSNGGRVSPVGLRFDGAICIANRFRFSCYTKTTRRVFAPCRFGGRVSPIGLRFDGAICIANRFRFSCYTKTTQRIFAPCRFGGRVGTCTRVLQVLSKLSTYLVYRSAYSVSADRQAETSAYRKFAHSRAR